MNNIAILLTCFNRKDYTYSCLVSLFELTKNSDVYLVDDESTDGTSEMVRNSFPEVNLIRGTGNLFWNRGMNLAWKHAAERQYDFYIWINDDVILHKDAMLELFRCSNMLNNQGIICGVIEDESRTKILYGGTNEYKQLVKPNGSMLSVHHMNGNVVLIPNYVFHKLGNLDIRYHHDLGDVDYGLRAKNNGIRVFSTTRPVGIGRKNTISRLRENGVSAKKRYLKLYSPLGSNPKINFYFRRKHFGIVHAILFFIFQHFLVIIPDKANNFLFKKKYQ